MEVFLSRFAFIFLIYAVVTSGYINEVLSCQMQKELTTSKYFRHMLGVLLIFVFIMLEGGWSFDKELDDMAETNWSSGNVIHTLMIGACIYLVFLISSKSKLVPNILFFGLIFIMYILNTQRNYLLERKRITEEHAAMILNVTKVIFGVAMVVLFYGFIDYVIYQRSEYGRNFSWLTFIFGTSRCRHVP